MSTTITIDPKFFEVFPELSRADTQARVDARGHITAFAHRREPNSIDRWFAVWACTCGEHGEVHGPNSASNGAAAAGQLRTHRAIVHPAKAADR